MTIFEKPKVIVAAIFIVVIVTSFYFYKEYNRKAADLTNVTPTEITDAATLVAAYDTDEEKANQQYLGKTIQVSGTIAEINNQQDTLITVAIGNTDDIHKVNCLLDKSSFNIVKGYAVGSPISIKGICTGFLIDVELNRCVIVTTNK